MLTAIRRVPGTTRFHPRSGDRAATLTQSALRAEVNDLHARLHQIEREQRVQFERIAQIQQQLDDLTKLLSALVEQKSSRKK